MVLYLLSCIPLYPCYALLCCRFQDVLRSAAGAPPLLLSCRLLDLFWERLGVSLHDLCTEEMRTFHLAGARLYPSLRRAAVDVYCSVEVEYRARLLCEHECD